MFEETCKVNGTFFGGEIKNNTFVMNKFMGGAPIQAKDLDRESIDKAITELQMIRNKMTPVRTTDSRPIRIEGLGLR